MHQTILNQINDHLASIAGLLVSLATIMGFRKKIFGFFLSIYVWFTRPSRIEVMLKEGAKERKELIAAVKNINYAIFNDGENGIAQQVATLAPQVAKLAACLSANFESAPYPSFEYTSGGSTTRVNDAYRFLIGAWHQSVIGAGRWQQAIHGELAEDYIDEQRRCASAREDFIGVCDFKNPLNDQHRGRWRVHATAVQINDDCLYIGRFVAALDDTAREIARENGWTVKMV